jgi:hypothetical protein
MTGCSRYLLALLAPVLILARAVSREAPSVDHQKFMGTWQIMTVKNLKTGEVDSIFKRRTLWTQYTSRTWTYVYMDTGRVGRKPAELAKLSSDARWRENYEKMWDGTGQWRFWGSGGTYWFDGNRMFYTNLISIEPYQLQLGGVEKVLYVNDTAYAYQSTPDQDGVVREYTHRRLDHGGSTMGSPEGSSAASMVMGNWQVTSRRNSKTGVTEDVAQRRTNWFHVTQNHWTFLWMTKDRRNLTPSDLAKLPAAEQKKERYAKIWDREDRPVFWASGGTYHVENGKFMVEPRIMSIEPWMIGQAGVEPIATLDRDTYVYQSAPDATGAVWETIHRRIDW